MGMILNAPLVVMVTGSQILQEIVQWIAQPVAHSLAQWVSQFAANSFLALPVLCIPSQAVAAKASPLAAVFTFNQRQGRSHKKQ